MPSTLSTYLVYSLLTISRFSPRPSLRPIACYSCVTSSPSASSVASCIELNGDQIGSECRVRRSRKSLIVAVTQPSTACCAPIVSYLRDAPTTSLTHRAICSIVTPMMSGRRLVSLYVLPMYGCRCVIVHSWFVRLHALYDTRPLPHYRSFTPPFTPSAIWTE